MPKNLPGHSFPFPFLSWDDVPEPVDWLDSQFLFYDDPPGRTTPPPPLPSFLPETSGKPRQATGVGQQPRRVRFPVSQIFSKASLAARSPKPTDQRDRERESHLLGLQAGSKYFSAARDMSSTVTRLSGRPSGWAGGQPGQGIRAAWLARDAW